MTAAHPGSLVRRGRYTLIEPLAEGGMGTVYAALRDGDKHLCALKQLRRDLEDDSIATRRFYREASVGARLTHPRIAQVFGAGREDGVFCIAMELVQGVDLATMHEAMLEQKLILPIALVSYVASAVLEGLAHAHNAKNADGTALGVVHRDITMRNIMVGFDGGVKIIDFGLVRAVSDDSLTLSGAFLGTPRFSSPEQVMGQKIDHRSDLYSLSAALFECVTGAPLIEPGMLLQMVAAICTRNVPSICALNPAVDPALAAVITRGLAKAREERWPDALSYLAALRGSPKTPIEERDVAAFMLRNFGEQAASMRALCARGQRLVLPELFSAPPTGASPSPALAGDDELDETTVASSEFQSDGEDTTVGGLFHDPAPIPTLGPPPPDDDADDTLAFVDFVPSTSYQGVEVACLTPEPALHPSLAPPPMALPSPRSKAADTLPPSPLVRVEASPERVPPLGVPPLKVPPLRLPWVTLALAIAITAIVSSVVTAALIPRAPAPCEEAPLKP